MTGPTILPPADATHAEGRGETTDPTQVAAFAAAVRAHLDDLPADEVEDLVDGLEADLIERTHDSSDPLGDPRAYADELRAAAGLPPRGSNRASGEWFGGYKQLARKLRAWVASERENRRVAAVLDFLVTLRPVWWVLRGWAAFRITVMLGSEHHLPDSLFGFLLLAGFVTVSVQWGRGRWLPWPALRIAKTAISALIVVALPVMLWSAATPLVVGSAGSDTSGSMEVAPAGLSVDGAQVTNIFPFDCAGQPLSGVQLFDQDGEPLEIGQPGGDGWQVGFDDEGADFAIVPNPDTTAGSGWNVVPLSRADFDDDYTPKTSTIEEAIAPFSAVQPLADADGSCEESRSAGDPGAGPAGDPADDPVTGPAETGTDPADPSANPNVGPGAE